MAPSLALATSTSHTYDFGQVYVQHVQRVARWVARLAGPRADVEDLVQDIFLRVHRRLAGFRGECEVSTWIYAITANVVRNWRRRDRLRRLLSFSDDDQVLDVATQAPSPSDLLERRRTAVQIYRALDGLGDNYRSVFILFELDGLSGTEIGRLLNISESAVWVRLSRARARLAERLRKEVRHG